MTNSEQPHSPDPIHRPVSNIDLFAAGVRKAPIPIESSTTIVSSPAKDTKDIQRSSSLSTYMDLQQAERLRLEAEQEQVKIDRARIEREKVCSLRLLKCFRQITLLV